MSSCPCRHCERRAIGCHCDCEGYKKFKEDRAAMFKDYDIRKEYDDWYISRLAKKKAAYMKRREGR